ncbi:MAG: PadR family transcriptional regulator [Candidatus Syntrophosphaera sp.]|nr:PadR family transcriptional regulator [Candidatus Syntrophosphaera sp.]
MSKPKLVVLGFLSRLPMYGYQIGHVVEEFDFPAWAGIRLPSIYKALQDLEASKHIRGEQVNEGNNPPRTVFHINAKGRELHSELVREYLSSPKIRNEDWWLALSFAWKAVDKGFLADSIKARIQRLEEANNKVRSGICSELISKAQLPFVHEHILRLGLKHHRAEIRALKELLADVISGQNEDFFSDTGENN